MRSFKQYLQEATEYDALQLMLFIDDNTVTPTEIDELSVIPEIASLNSRATYLQLEFQLQENFDDTTINKLMQIIRTKAPKASFLNTGLQGRMFCNRLPLKYTINITNDKLPIAIRTTPNLKDINKSIIAAKYIELFNEENVQKNVLSLFKVKGLKHIGRYASISGSQEKWLNIVNRHLAGDRKLLDCQEELIDAGLEEYAQL